MAASCRRSTTSSWPRRWARRRASRSRRTTLPLTAWSDAGEGRLDVTTGGKDYRCDLSGKGACVRKERRTRRAVARQAPRSLHPRLEPVDARRRQRRGNAAHHRRHRQTSATPPTTPAGSTPTSAILVWSPDSTKIATFQQDQRKTSEMVLVGTNVGAPKVERWKYPLRRRRAHHHDRARHHRRARRKTRVVRLKMPPDQHRSTLCDDVSCEGGWEDVQWAPDGRTLAFASTSRDHKQTWLRIADADTGDVRTVFDEKVKTYFESGNGAVNWRYLPQIERNPVVQRAQQLGQPVPVRRRQRQAQARGDDGRRAMSPKCCASIPPRARVWFRGVGQENGRNPYYQHFYKVGLDGGTPVLLTPEDADHTVALSPGRHATSSTPIRPPPRRRSRCCARPTTAAWCARSRAPTSRACRRRAGSRRNRSRSRRATARPTCTA